MHCTGVAHLPSFFLLYFSQLWHCNLHLRRPKKGTQPDFFVTFAVYFAKLHSVVCRQWLYYITWFWKISWMCMWPGVLMKLKMSYHHFCMQCLAGTLLQCASLWQSLQKHVMDIFRHLFLKIRVDNKIRLHHIEYFINRQGKNVI